MTWNIEPTGTVARAVAIERITEMAKEDGITGSFKVYYNDALIANPNDLPEQVELSKIRVSAVLDNARS